MFKNGFKFLVVKTNIIGIIDGTTTTGIYSVCFYENGKLYLQADVYEGTIKNNLQSGVYKAIA